MHTKETELAPKRLLLTIAILLFLIVFVIISSQSLGRYTTSFDGAVEFSPNARPELYVTENKWDVNATEGNQTMSFSVSNSNTDDYPDGDVFVRVRLYASDANATLPTVTLAHNGATVIARASVINSQTPAYKDYGAGQILRFCDASGEEITFVLNGGAVNTFNAVLTLQDGTVDTNDFKLVIETVNKDGGEL